MLVSEKIKITKEMVINFSELVGDKNPLHLDMEYCANTKFEKPIVHGMFLSSFFSKLISEKYPGPGSIYLSQNLSFISPCFVDDTVNVVIELKEKINNKYYLKTIIYALDGNKIIEGDALILKK
jgi:3-hydroxybutyryl-CoA dehydratase